MKTLSAGPGGVKRPGRGVRGERGWSERKHPGGVRGSNPKARDDQGDEETPRTVGKPREQSPTGTKNHRGPNPGRRPPAPGSRLLGPATLQEKRGQARRPPRTLLEMLAEQWEESDDEIKDLLTYTKKLRETLYAVWEKAHKTLRDSQEKQKKGTLSAGPGGVKRPGRGVRGERGWSERKHPGGVRGFNPKSREDPVDEETPRTVGKPREQSPTGTKHHRSPNPGRSPPAPGSRLLGSATLQEKHGQARYGAGDG
ncbi:hypothetical protein NDU88_006728 [Pleurodeles waltl]|uniref:Uncharacterized protein n=1 Tax=Pleurodeles waltl TaxID=8319 RepID=A0AAV7RR32_PLEWA|nr:hypothetical protein NDU88_006728 [Pleurodeles waltl]